jgi:hypothetical protein
MIASGKQVAAIALAAGRLTSLGGFTEQTSGQLVGKKSFASTGRTREECGMG